MLSVDTLTGMAKGPQPKRAAKLYIAEWMAIRGLSIDALAGKLNVSYQTVWRYIEGERRPHIQKIKAIADALDIDLAELSKKPGEAAQGALLAGLTPSGQQQALDYIAFLHRKRE